MQAEEPDLASVNESSNEQKAHQQYYELTGLKIDMGNVKNFKQYAEKVI